MKKILPIILVVLLLAALAAGGWAGYKIYTLEGQKAALLGEVAGLEKKNSQLQTKLAEEKSLSSQYLKLKSNLESELRSLQVQNADLTTKLEASSSELYAEIAKLKAASETAAVNHQKKIDKYTEVISQWKTQYEALHAESITKIQVRDEKISSLTNENYTLDSHLNSEKQEHDHCRRENARFAILSQELVQKYAEKNVIDALKTLEPLTQLEKIELEKMVQKYQDDIDKSTL
nr:hypothetical protein [Desulfobulbaceae bacterium]